MPPCPSPARVTPGTRTPRARTTAKWRRLAPAHGHRGGQGHLHAARRDRGDRQRRRQGTPRARQRARARPGQGPGRRVAVRPHLQHPAPDHARRLPGPPPTGGTPPGSRLNLRDLDQPSREPPAGAAGLALDAWGRVAVRVLLVSADHRSSRLLLALPGGGFLVPRTASNGICHDWVPPGAFTRSSWTRPGRSPRSRPRPSPATSPLAPP